MFSLNLNSIQKRHSSHYLLLFRSKTVFKTTLVNRIFCKFFLQPHSYLRGTVLNLSPKWRVLILFVPLDRL